MRRYSLLPILIFVFAISAQPGSSISLLEGLSNLLYNIRYLPIGLVQFLYDDFQFSRQEFPDTDVPNNSEFDFIVVGAGSAGSIISARLTEDNFTVLLVEAGGPEHLLYDIPLAALFYQFSALNWDFRTEPSDKYCRGMVENRCAWVRGRVMGGTSTINAMIVTRGGSADYDAWEAMGNPGWGYKDVLKYFMKIERVLPSKDQNYDYEYRGTEGPIPVGYSYHSPVADAFLQAASDAGFERIDYNGKQHIGFSIIQANIEKGERFSANRAYLRPIRDRKNLVLTRTSLVTKVNMDKGSKRALGVTYLKNGKKITVKARREVILSAGAIQTPQLLMVSGLGPAEELKRHKIEVIKDIPGVGQNLVDHVTYFSHDFVMNTTGLTYRTQDIVKPTDRKLAQYFGKREGFVAGDTAVEAIGYVNVDDLEARDGQSNIENLYLDGSLPFNDRILQRGLLMKPEIFHKTYAKYQNYYSFSIIPVLLKPKSRGEIKLRSSDVRDKPIIIPNYYDHPDDVKTMIKGLKFQLELAKKPSLQKYNATLVPEPIWGCQNYTFMSDDYWECAIRTLTFTFWHFGGTATMGPESNPMSVVDERLKVSCELQSGLNLIQNFWILSSK